MSRSRLLNKHKSTLSNYWYRTRRMWREFSCSDRQMPDFIIAGAQRSGTTSLFSFLTQDKAFFTPIKKEIHYFDNFYFKGEKWYRSHFPKASNNNCIVGEASPYYMFHPLAMQRIAKDVGNVKIILVLRNPIERAYSHYKWEVSKGYENLSFEEALDAEEKRLDGEEENIIKDTNYYSISHQHYSYVSRGKYAPQVKKIYELFGSDNCLVLASEQLFSKEKATISRLSNFLGVPSLGFDSFRLSNATKKSSMNEQTRAHLSQEFEDSNSELFSLINEKFIWE